MASPVHGESEDQAVPAVSGENTGGGDAVFGHSGGGRGVVGVSDFHTAVEGNSLGGGTGVYATSDSGEAIHGESRATERAAIAAIMANRESKSPALWAESRNNLGVAGFFKGDVNVDGNIHLSGTLFGRVQQDYAEALPATDPNVQPGSVVVVSDDGDVRPCAKEYDTAVAGIVSGAGGLQPAVVLGDHDRGVTVALMGTVWCLADADVAPIRPGDLLTSSSTPGHARSVTEPSRALGTIIGKALTPLPSGCGLVQVLVSSR